MPDLANETALVTGGGQGIGRGIALELAAAGADLVVAHVPEAEPGAAAVAAEATELGRRALAVPLDVTDAESIAAAVESALAALGDVSILVNNAGVMQRGSGLDTGRDDFDLCYRVNVAGVWNVTHGLLPHFEARGGARIVNVASTAGRRGQPETPAYSASKAAAISVTQSLAAALGPRGINVNAVCPGLVWTPMSEQWLGVIGAAGATDATDMATFLDELQPSLPLGRHVTAADIGKAVAFLASADAQAITGQALNVDGGFTTS
jgi:NAD(P)-dependent dehydrogenase (short-subunit alcohol dehydrogenase family)